MKRRALLPILIMIPVLPVFAQDEGAAGASPVPSPVQWSLGVGAFSSPRPYVGADSSRIVAPLIEVSSKRLYVQGIQAGYRLIESDRFGLDARVGIVFNGLDPDDSPALEGMAERRSSIEGGLVFDWKPGRYRLSTSVTTDLLGRSYGQQVAADFSRLWTFDRYRWGFAPSIGVVWQSSNFVDYYYGITPEEVRPDRPSFRGHAAVNLQSSLFAFYYLNVRVRLVGLVRIQRLDNEISNSPIVDRPRGIFALVGITHRFGKLPPRP